MKAIRGFIDRIQSLTWWKKVVKLAVSVFVVLIFLFVVWLINKPDVIQSDEFYNRLEAGKVKEGDVVHMEVQSISITEDNLGSKLWVDDKVIFLDALDVYDVRVHEFYYFEVREFNKIGTVWYLSFVLRKE